MTIDTTDLGALASIALKATLLLAIAVVIDWSVLRRASAAARHQLWTFAVVAVLLLPVLAWALPGWFMPLPTHRPAETASPSASPGLTSANDARVTTTQSSRSIPASTAPEVGETTGSAAVAAARAIPWTLVLLVVYGAGVLLLLTRIAVEQLIVRRWARGGIPEYDTEWTETLASTVVRLGIRRHVGLLRSTEQMMPITWGIVRPFVMVPAGSSSWPAARREAVLVHELAHVVRHDCLTQTLAAVACALYWPHPGIWWAARRLRVERELACDDRVVRGGIEPRDYAGHLLEIARTLRPPRPLGALAVGMATTSHIEMRLRAAIDGARRRTSPGRGATVANAAFSALLVMPLAAFRAPVAEPAPNVDPVGAATRDLGRPTTGAAPRGSAQRVLGGTWNLRVADPAEAGMQGLGTVIHISMFTPGLNTFYAPLSRFEGVSMVQIGSVADSNAVFTLHRGPGTFTFTGTISRGRGAGRFTFTPDSTFGAELARRGMQPPTAEQQLTLARHGVGLEMLEELAAQGYATPSTSALVHASSSGPELAELRALDSLGYRFGTLESVTRFHSSGITPDYIRELASVGYRNVPAAQLIRARNQSVTADFARQANASAGRQLSISELVSLRSRGEASSLAEPAVRPAAAAPTPGAPTPGTPASTAPPATSAAEPTPLAGSWVLMAKWGPGLRLDIDWDGNNQWARQIDLSELRGLSSADVNAAAPTRVAFRVEEDAGVFEYEGTFLSGRGSGRFRFEPNHTFAATLRSLGVQDTEAMSDHDLKNLAFSGVSTKAVRELLALGVTPLTRGGLVDLAVRQVTPEYVRALRAAEVTDANTAEGITEIRFSGVTPMYVTELAALGYRRLDGSQIIDMWRNKVTPEFIRRMQDAGYRAASPDSLIELRRRR